MKDGILMKILYIDTSLDGHHLGYLAALISGREEDSILVLPKLIENIKCKQYLLKNKEKRSRNFKKFYLFINEIYEIVRAENPDVIHFLTGDIFYRFFGWGLFKFRKYKTIITLHWIRTGFLERVSTKLICRQITSVVVHSEYMKKYLWQQEILNVINIEYPNFNNIKVDAKQVRNDLGLNDNAPVIACIGNTRFDKGLDILLKALKGVKEPFKLLIAGKSEAFDEKFILKETSSYKDKLILHLHYLTDRELAEVIAASDIIALPYRKKFNGASGPLVEGVYLGKCIIGPNHGNLGKTIRDNHLGYVFETESIVSLKNTMEKALRSRFYTDKVYETYRGHLNVATFKKNHEILYRKVLE
ncbi:glycosyltransferase family 4 protein [Phascolarctobacterium faecium]|uniref:glycosyltransferase family 4 protein n=1 Tax=Phascolarctobacterium faecium TaxID=33025 RepID=UPI0032BF5A23